MIRLYAAFILSAGFFLSSVISSAQDDRHCYTTEIFQELVKAHPEILNRRKALEEFTDQYHGTLQHRTAGQVYIIPIVFHVIHNYGPENISDAQIEDQVRIMNDDYRKRSYDTAFIVPAFKSIAADCEIEFRLATVDPNGNCTNGIEHILSPLTYAADDNSKLDPWPADQYLNVWTVASLAWEGAAAYAYYPGTAPPGADGVITLSGYVGSIGTGAIGRSRVLTHEVGHYLNLSHVWGDTNDPGVACGDDGVFDTPVTKGWQSCNINGASCGNVIDNVQNYMEYSYCCNMFTQGQKDRMQSALNSGIGSRNNLWTVSNLALTGTNGNAQVCIPVADFIADHKTVCAGTTVQFNDASWNAHPISWSWNFPGGFPSSSTDSAPFVQYNTPGVYNVSLTSGNSAGSNSLTKNLFVHVNGVTAQPIPYVESFEAAGSFPGTDGYVENTDNGNSWQRVTNAASTGSASIMINNFSGNPIGETDEYITPAVDLTNITAPYLSFKVAYAQRNSFSADALKVYVSADCGQSWVLKYNRSSANLVTAGIVPGNFIPDASQWRMENVSIPFANHSSVRFKFQNISGGGNNIYVDDINITGTLTGIENQNISSFNFEIFPNPSNDIFNLSFDIQKPGMTEIIITDVLGREVKAIARKFLSEGRHQYAIQAQEFNKGIYLLTLKIEGQPFTKRLIIE
jgi:PKD repeat protein